MRYAIYYMIIAMATAILVLTCTGCTVAAIVLSAINLIFWVASVAMIVYTDTKLQNMPKKENYEDPFEEFNDMR